MHIPTQPGEKVQLQYDEYEPSAAASPGPGVSPGGAGLHGVLDPQGLRLT